MGSRMSDVLKRLGTVQYPQCKAMMEEIVRIAPLQDDPGLIGYECPSCKYVTSFFLAATKPQGRITRSTSIPMALKLRRTGLGSGIDKNRQDYTVYTGGWDIGRIYETRGGPEHLRWFWSFAQHGPVRRSGRVKTLEEAKSKFQKSWEEWKAWANLEEVS
jgi:hypothetical protein